MPCALAAHRLGIDVGSHHFACSTRARRQEPLATMRGLPTTAHNRLIVAPSRSRDDQPFSFTTVRAAHRIAGRARIASSARCPVLARSP